MGRNLICRLYVHTKLLGVAEAPYRDARVLFFILPSRKNAKHSFIGNRGNARSLLLLRSGEQLVATLRPVLLRTLHLSGVKEIDVKALAMFDAYVSDRSGSPLPADLR